MYLSFRSLDSIVHIYVASNNLKTISLVAASKIIQMLDSIFDFVRNCFCILRIISLPVYPELCSKKDPFLMYGLTSSFLIWIAANVASAYSVYYNVIVLPILFSVLQFYIIALLATGRWVQIVGTNDVGRFKVKNLLIIEANYC